MAVAGPKGQRQEQVRPACVIAQGREMWMTVANRGSLAFTPCSADLGER